MEINNAQVVAELRELAWRYEAALVGNDVEALTTFFWRSPAVVRFGVTENLYGSDQLDEFRRARPAAGLARKVLRLDVTSFGTDFGSVTLEFERETRGGKVYGRQSQVWVRFAEGWRVTAAHVSLLPDTAAPSSPPVGT